MKKLSKHWKLFRGIFQTLEKRWIVLFFVLFALGCALRIFGAWGFRYISDPDCGIVALMARHVVAGSDWPVFFYGQSYMGSLEPLTSALFCKLFGVNGLYVSLGTVFYACLSLAGIFFVGCLLGGRWVGLLSLALCLIGPRTFYMFQFAPRGGYMIALFCGLLVLGFCARLANRCAEGKVVSGWQFLGVGFVAGAGWWSNAIITPALIAGAFVIGLGLRGKLAERRILVGVLGFVLGSLPFWLWNFTHDWESLKILASLGGVSFSQGFKLLWEKYVYFITSAGLPEIYRLIMAVMWLVLALLGSVAGLRHSRSRMAAIGVLLFLIVSVILFIRSDYAQLNTLRYLVPVYPALAILAANAVGKLRGVVAAVLTVALLVFAFASQIPVLSEVTLRSARGQEADLNNQKLFNFLEKEGVEALYSHFRHHALNFNSGESVIFTDMRGDRYLPYMHQAELTDRIAVWENFGRISDFLDFAGGSAQTKNFGMQRLEYGFVAPLIGLHEIRTEKIMNIHSSCDEDLNELLLDRDMDSRWVSRCSQKDDDFLEVNLANPQNLRGLRLVTDGNLGNNFFWRIDCRLGFDTEWTEILPERPLTDFYWSGTRPFWNGRRLRHEARFESDEITALRIHFRRKVKNSAVPLSLNELQFFGAGPMLLAEESGYSQLKEQIIKLQIKSLYADRWISNRLYEDLAGNIEVELASYIFPEIGVRRGGELEWKNGSALLVLRRDAETTRAILNKHGLGFDELEVDPWTLFVVKPNSSERAVNPKLYWTGYTCFSGDGRRYAYDCLSAAMMAKNDAQALALLKEGYSAYPNMIAAADEIIERLDNDELRELREQLTAPEVEIQARFDNGIELLGVSLSPRKAAPGEKLTIRYYWRYPPEIYAGSLAVFAHFQQDKILFQNDHVFLANFSSEQLENVGFRETYVEEMVVEVPANVPKGACDLVLGLYNRKNFSRISVKSVLPIENKAIMIKALFL